MNNTFRFLRILSGLSKTLNIAKNVIPIYKDTKPVVNNLKTFYKTIKLSSKSAKSLTNNEIKSNQVKTTNETKENNDKKITTQSDNSKSINPKFFL